MSGGGLLFLIFNPDGYSIRRKNMTENKQIRLLNRNLTFLKGEYIQLSFFCAYRDNPLKIVLRNDRGKIGEYPMNEVNGIYTTNLGGMDTGLYFFDIYDGDEYIFGEQLLVYERKYSRPDFLDNGIIYHIFVDRFCRGKGVCEYRDDVKVVDSFGNFRPEYPEKPGGFILNNDFAGGNLSGIEEKLDYIEQLGVCAVYLSPVCEAYSNHKYDTADYTHVDRGFGGDEALRSLIKECGRRGIAVILDGVFNHTGADSIYFNRKGRYDSVGAYQSENSPFYPWYEFRDYPDDYECWWGVKTLPRIKSGCREYYDFISGDGGVIDRWFDMGIKGVRLDVADELEPEFVEMIAAKVKSRNGYLLGEVWEDASSKISYGRRRYYFCGRQLDGVMNYPLREGIIDFLVWKNSVKLKQIVSSLYLHYPPDSYKYSTAFLGSHDTERIMTVLAGEYCGEHTNAELSVMRMTEEQRTKGRILVKAAYLLLVMLGGIPCLYYGDEVGMEGYRDPFNRGVFPWGDYGNEYDMLTFFRKIGMLKKTGELSDSPVLDESDEKSVICRRGDYVAVVNMSDGYAEYRIRGKYTDVLEGKSGAEILGVNGGRFALVKMC